MAITGIAGYFRSHPLPEERINQIEQIIARRKWPEHSEKALRVRSAATKTEAANH